MEMELVALGGVGLKLHAVAPGGPPESHHGRSMEDEEQR